MRIGPHRLLLVAVLVAGAAALRAQQTPSFSTAVEAVEIDAFVSDRDGKPVSDLKQTDFELREDGKPQSIISFSLVNIPIVAPEPYRPGAPVPDVATNRGGEGRLYVFALDELCPVQTECTGALGEDAVESSSNNGATWALRARAFLRQFISEHFEPTDIGIVVSIGRARAGDMQDFTSNRQLLLKAIDTYIGGFPIPDTDGSFTARSQAQALRALIESLAAIHGRRKTVILVSHSVGQQGVLGGADVFDVLDYRGGVRSLQFDDLRAAMTAAMRGGVAFYPIDPAGADPAALGGKALQQMDSLRGLAEATGGFAVVNSNRYPEAFSRIVTEASSYYLLGFTSTNSKRDGRYRRLEVKVNRPGLTVRSRDGYIAASGREAPAKNDTDRSTLTAAVRGAVATPLATSEVPMSVFATALRGSGKGASVVISVEMDPTRLNLITSGGGATGEVEVAALAISAAGKVAGGRQERFTLRLTPDSWEHAKTSGLRLVTGTTLPAGRYQLRVAAGNIARPDAGSVMYDLDVPDFGQGDLTMSAPLLATTHDALTVAPATRLRADLSLAPTTQRDFTPGETLSLYTEVYDNSRDRARRAVDVTAELRDESGRAMRSIKRHDDAAPGGKHAISITIPMNVPAGSYVLHLEADSNNKRIARDIPVRVH